jgi:hypothetical protein
MIDIQTLLDRVAKTDYKDVIEDPEIGLHPNQSEFLVFLKPEIFMGERLFQEKRVQMINDLLETHGVTIDGMLIVGGKFIEEKGIMAAHYGFINQISNHASEIVTDGERAKMTELLGEDCSQTLILGGHEALKKFTTLNPESLDTLWFTKKSLKVKGGFYFQKYTYEGVTFLLVDGFHPQQLDYFTRPDRGLMMMLNDDTWVQEHLPSAFGRAVPKIHIFPIKWGIALIQPSEHVPGFLANESASKLTPCIDNGW